MVSNTGAEVSSKALMELQSNLIALSKNLKELYDALHDNRSKLSEEWRDEKYDEFAEEFEQSERVISELSEKYSEWANKYLPPRIGRVIDIENARGTLGGGSGLSGIPGGNVGGSSSDKKTLPSDKDDELRGLDRMIGKNPESVPADDESIKFSKTLFGMRHKIKADGTAHTTYYDGKRNSRVSFDTDKDGNVRNLHSTDQNKSKKDPTRHK